MEFIKEYYYPSTLEEAINLLKADNSIIIAGGTHLVTQKSSSYNRLVDLRNLNLNYIKEGIDSIIHIGSMTTISEIIKSQYTQKIGNGILVKACKGIGDTPLRNVITLGGNIACRVPWAELPVILLILDAKIQIITQGNKIKNLSAVEFFSENKIQNTEIIKEIVFPLKSNYYSKYEKFALTKTDLSWLNLGLSLKVNNGIIEDPHFAVSRIMRPTRLIRIENLLKEKEISGVNIEEVVSKLGDSVQIVADYRSSKEYRFHLLKVLFTRMMKEIIQEASV